MPRAVAFACACTLALAAGACQPRTELVLGFATDLHATGELDNISLHVTRHADGTLEGSDRSWSVSGALDVPVNLPASYGLYSDDGDVALDITLSATHANQMVVSQSVVLSLVSGQTLFYRMGLTAECQAQTCAGSQTCIAGTCVEAQIANRLPSYTQELVTTLSCHDGIDYIDTATGSAMGYTADAASCPADLCSQGTCLLGSAASGSDAGVGVRYMFEEYAKASNTGSNANFGAAIAVATDGNTIVVGADGEASNGTGVNDTAAQGDTSDGSAGAAYVFVPEGSATWSQQAYLKASNTDAMDQLGYAVAISGDGNTIALGAISEASNGTGVNDTTAETDNSVPGAGAVYVFTRSGTVWSQAAYIKASNTRGSAFFGSSLALDYTGATLAVGSYGENSASSTDQSNMGASNAGAVYVFALAGTWSQQAYVKAVAPVPVEDALFGIAVALGSDGNTLAVGASGAAAGAAYVFTRSGATWSQQAELEATNGDPGDQFGDSISLSADGNTLAVGAYREASAATGVSPAGSDNGSDNSDVDAGAAYVYTRAGTTWSPQVYVKASNTDASDEFGYSVALSADGATLAVGALGEASSAVVLGGDQTNNDDPAAGAVYIYALAGTTWSQIDYAKSVNTEAGQQFGYSVAVSGNGQTVPIGAIGESSSVTGLNGEAGGDGSPSSGAAYFFFP